MTKRTSLIYEDFEDLAISSDEYISDVRLNQTFGKLIKNDIALSPYNSERPHIWECRWFNNSKIAGYPIGYAVWLNTENQYDFIVQKSNEIYQYAKNNSYLASIIKPFDHGSKDIFELYANILTGYIDSNLTTPLQPLFDIGQLSSSTQIYISKIDNNKRSPTEDLCYPEAQRVWKPFIKSIDLISEMISSYQTSLYERHIENYHFGEDLSHDPQHTFLTSYLTRDLSNLDAIQTCQEHIKACDLVGFDSVKYYVADKNTASVDISSINGYHDGLYVYEQTSAIIHSFVSTALSTEEFPESVIKDTNIYMLSTVSTSYLSCVVTGDKIIYDVPTKWFKLWHSGLLEHGGVVNVHDSGSYLLKIAFDWKFNETSGAITTQYTAPIYNYPTTENSFYQNYSQIELEHSEYNSSRNFIEPYRYSVDFTPMTYRNPQFEGNELPSIGYATTPTNGVYLNKEVIEMKNDYIQLKLYVNRPGYYSYYIRGFKTDNYEI